MLRNKYIDSLKGALMILVVIGHFYFLDYNSNILVYIYSFHMPAFLIIGGYLLNNRKNNDFISNLKSRFANVFVPYFIFNIIAIALFSTDISRYNNFANMVLGIGNPDNAINLPTWFLPFYFFTISLYDAIKLLSKKILPTKNSRKEKQKAILNKNDIFEITIVVILVIIGYLIRIYETIFWIPYNIQQILFCIFFVCFGEKTAKLTSNFKSYKIKNNTNTFFLIITTLIAIFLWYNLALKNGRIDINAKDYKNKILFFTTAIFGFYWFSNIILCVNKIPFISDILSFLGKNSIYILGYHIITVAFIRLTINPIFSLEFQEKLSYFNIISLFYYTFLEISIALFFGIIHKTILKK